MALATRENPDNGQLEVLVNDQWVRFDEYRSKQIDDAYQTSVQFLRERLGEDQARKLADSINETKS
ncbi:MAG: hypothetical protein HOP19_26180 [Acidobacteria bacterium]|nr:hypothetical protein [Acidobacteriota bacterium]